MSVLAKQALVPVWPIPDEVYSVYKHEVLMVKLQ